MDKNKMRAKKRVRVSTQKMKDLQSSPPTNEQSGCFAFVRWEDGYTGKIFTGSDILARDEAPVQLQDLKSGDPVLAKWSDGKFYSATIEYISKRDGAKPSKGRPTPQEAFLSMLNCHEPSDSTSGSDTIIIDRSPVSEHVEKIQVLNQSPNGGHAAGCNTAGPPSNGSTKGGNVGPSPYGGSTTSPSPYGLNTSGPPPYSSHTPRPSLHGLNTSGPSPYSSHTPSPSLYERHTSGPSPYGGHTASLPTTGVSQHDRRDAGISSDEGNIHGQQAENAWTPCDRCRREFEKILHEKRRIDEVISRIDPGQARELQTLCNLIGEKHRDSPASQSGQQELFPWSSVFISSFRLAAVNQASKPNCMHLFHALFDHFFTVEECQNAVPFGRPGNNSSGKEGKRVLDRTKVEGILSTFFQNGSSVS